MPNSGQKNPWSFSLAELLIGTTFVCVLLAVTLALPEWGIFLWILSGFALTRTIWYSIAWKRAGKAFSPLAQIGSLAESLLVMALISAAATVAFMGVCLPLGLTVTRCCAPSYVGRFQRGVEGLVFAWGEKSRRRRHLRHEVLVSNHVGLASVSIRYSLWASIYFSTARGVR